METHGKDKQMKIEEHINGNEKVMDILEGRKNNQIV
jgi:hypothetical protein